MVSRLRHGACCKQLRSLFSFDNLRRKCAKRRQTAPASKKQEKFYQFVAHWRRRKPIFEQNRAPKCRCKKFICSLKFNFYFQSGKEDFEIVEKQIEKWTAERKLALVKSPPVVPKPIYKNEINLVKLETFCELFLEENFNSDAGTPLIRKRAAFKIRNMSKKNKQPFFQNQPICSIQTSLRKKTENSKRKTKFSLLIFRPKVLKSTTILVDCELRINAIQTNKLK